MPTISCSSQTSMQDIDMCISINTCSEVYLRQIKLLFLKSQQQHSKMSFFMLELFSFVCDTYKFSVNQPSISFKMY